MFLPMKPLARASAIGGVDAIARVAQLAADVDVRRVAVDGVRRDDDALEHLVRVELEDLAILERAGSLSSALTQR
jgi:hypothetical protein